MTDWIATSAAHCKRVCHFFNLPAILFGNRTLERRAAALVMLLPQPSNKCVSLPWPPLLANSFAAYDMTAHVEQKQITSLNLLGSWEPGPGPPPVLGRLTLAGLAVGNGGKHEDEFSYLIACFTVCQLYSCHCYPFDGYFWMVRLCSRLTSDGWGGRLGNDGWIGHLCTGSGEGRMVVVAVMAHWMG